MDKKIQSLVRKLIERGMTPASISEGMDYRVSSRTVYRWAKGDCVPQNKRNREVLEKLVSSVEEVRSTPKQPEAKS
tara:strand:+ start:5032 stop:5259 length:228 start_codon:yes stop_codon:yes gene_type:complete